MLLLQFRSASKVGIIPPRSRWFELDTVLIHRQKSLFLTLSSPPPPPPNCVSNDFSCRRRRTWFTHVRVAIWSKIIQVFYDKKWPYDHFGGLYDGEFIWLYGNVIFMVICCSPSRRESILWSWFAENDCENGANSPAFHFLLRREQLRWGNRLKRPRIILKLRIRLSDNLTLR